MLANLKFFLFNKENQTFTSRKLLLFAVMFLSVYHFAQTNRFLYELVIQKSDETVHAVMALDIDGKAVKFYDYEFVQQDSLRKATGKNLQFFSPTEQMLTRTLNSNTNQSYLPFQYGYYSVKTDDKINWKLSPETKKVENYTLQKAVADFGGRSWTAWFTTEIPFQEGPYKFRGLSGLIFEVFDYENIFHYTLMRSQKLPKTYDTSDFLETRYGKLAMPITLQQYHKLKLDYYNNIVQTLSDFKEKGNSIASGNGERELHSKEDILAERKAIQKSIKKYYLPVEKDRAIPYPAD